MFEKKKINVRYGLHFWKMVSWLNIINRDLHHLGTVLSCGIEIMIDELPMETNLNEEQMPKKCPSKRNLFLQHILNLVKPYDMSKCKLAYCVLIKNLIPK